MKIRIKRIEKRLELLIARAELERGLGDIAKYDKTIKYISSLKAKLETLILG